VRVSSHTLITFFSPKMDSRYFHQRWIGQISRFISVCVCESVRERECVGVGECVCVRVCVRERVCVGDMYAQHCHERQLRQIINLINIQRLREGERETKKQRKSICVRDCVCVCVCVCHIPAQDSHQR